MPLTADSLPAPGPDKLISTSCIPNAIADFAASCAATVSANAEDLREPIYPTFPDDAQATTLPVRSVMETIVLLNVALTCTTPLGTVRIVFFLALATALVVFGQLLIAIVLLLFLVNIIKLAYAKPELIEYRIDRDGIRVSNWLHAFNREVIAYTIVEHNHQHVLILKTKGLWTDHLTLPIGKTSPKKIAKILDDYLPIIASPLDSVVQVRSR